MANWTLFKTDYLSTNEAGGVAYKGTPKQALAQLASTGCLSNTLYVSAKNQLDNILSLANKCDPEYVAKVAVFSREKHGMKDVPALLCVWLAANRKSDMLKKVFSRVINNGDMLRNFFQMTRSGQAGRRSFGTLPKRLMTNWFNSRTPAEVFDQSIGQPSMRDMLRCIRPRPLDGTRSAMYAWMVGKTYDHDALPSKVQAFERWKVEGGDVPPVDFRMLTNTPLTSEQWTTIAKRAGWKWLLKNLNNMVKHGVFQNQEMIDFVTKRLSDRTSILKARAFPYQILTAYQNTEGIPQPVREALHAAMEVATENVPSFPEAKGNIPPVYLCVDVSKSMTFPLTGNRFGYGSYGRFNQAVTKVMRVDVAALIACSILRKNKGGEIVCFNDAVTGLNVDPAASIMDNANHIAKSATGATACSAPLKMLNDEGRHGDLIVMVSDDQSWKESLNIDKYGKRQKGETALQVEWKKWKNRNQNAKLVCIDVAPYTTTQVQEMPDVLNIGGWSDTVFEMVGSFASGTMHPDHLVGVIEQLNLDGEPQNAVEIEE